MREFVGKSVSWLCASPESASSGSPVSDRQTQRQAQAGGGGGRAGGGGGGGESVESWKTARSGAPKEMKPNPSKETET